MSGAFSLRKFSAASPVATHAGHDHRAARSKFLNIGGVAYAHRIRARIVAGIDLFLLVIIRMDAKSCRRPAQFRWRVLRRGLGNPRPRGRVLRFRSISGKHKGCRESQNQRCRPDPHRRASLKPVSRSFSNIAVRVQLVPCLAEAGKLRGSVKSAAPRAPFPKFATSRGTPDANFGNNGARASQLQGCCYRFDAPVPNCGKLRGSVKSAAPHKTGMRRCARSAKRPQCG
jgi:hypothetical protein